MPRRGHGWGPYDWGDRHGWKRGRWKRGRRRWGLRRRFTLAFAFVALAAVSVTTFFTLGAVFSAQGELFGVEAPMRGGFGGGHDGWQGRDDPRFAAAGEAFRRITRTAFVAALLSFFLASSAAAFVTRFLTRPLAALTDGARRLAAGERGLRLELPSSQDELRVLTEAFNGLTEGLERQEAWRRNLVADIAHDLRTPLAVMRSELEAMQDGVVSLDEDGLARLHTEVLRLSKLVDDLRTLSLAESGGLALRLEPTPLKPLLEETLETFATRARQAGLTLTLEPVPDALAADLDRNQIGRVLGNLLDNALRYAAPGAVEVGAARNDAGVNAGVSVWVRDHGPGLPRETLERLFERFYRGDAARTREREGGSGLGLTIARAIAEAHGGGLEADNHEDGAVFTLHLPARSA